MIDYQWSPNRQQIAVESTTKACDQESVARGVAIDTNGDWLLLTKGFSGAAALGETLWRSSDRGASFSKVGTLPGLDSNTHSASHGRLFVTRQGRILTYCECWPRQQDSPLQHARQKHIREPLCIGDNPTGRPVYLKSAFIYMGLKVCMVYSDDGGKTWQMSVFLDAAPLHHVCSHCSGMMMETANGDLVLPCQGWLRQGRAYGWTMCSGYMRSADGGLTWSDPVIIFRSDDERGQWFNETAVLPRQAAPWVAIARMNPLCRIQKPSGHGHLGGYRSFSCDEGQSWTEPEPVTDTTAYPMLFEVADGGILFAASRWSATYVAISYDDGSSWAYQMQVPCSGGDTHTWVQPDEDTLVVAHKDITHQKIALTWFTKTPTRRAILAEKPPIPEHRWTVRDLKNLYLDEHLLSFCTAASGRDERIVVAGVRASSTEQVITICSSDPNTKWSAPVVVSEVETHRHIYPRALSAIAGNKFIMVCTEDENPKQFEAPTRVRTFVSEQNPDDWREVSAISDLDGICSLRPGSSIVADDEGGLVLTICGIDDHGRSVCGIVHWPRGGIGWSSFVPFMAADNTDDIFDQPAVLPLTKRRWLAVFRANLAKYRIEYTNGRGQVTRVPPLWSTVSHDGGRSWSQPSHLVSATQPHLVRLSDGGLVLTSICGSHLRYQVSYNGGASWSFENTVISYPAEWIDSGRVAMSDLSLVSVNDQTLLGVYFCNDEYEGGPRLAAAWIRALPVTSPEARERGL